MRMIICGVVSVLVATSADACFRGGYDLQRTVEFLNCMSDENEFVMQEMQQRLNAQEDAINQLTDIVQDVTSELSSRIELLEEKSGAQEDAVNQLSGVVQDTTTELGSRIELLEEKSE